MKERGGETGRSKRESDLEGEVMQGEEERETRQKGMGRYGRR